MFPDQIQLPSSVQTARKTRRRELRKSIQRGVLIRLAIIAAELVGYLYFESHSLLYDAIASSWDILASLVLVIAVSLASRPPDEEHPFGHGRYEPLAGLQLSLIMITLGAILLMRQGVEFALPVTESIHPWTWTIPAAAVILLEICYQFMMATAKKTHSAALSADAIHFRIDALNSFLAAIALISASVFPSYSQRFDQTGAMMIAILMIVLGLVAARKNIHQLTDKVPNKTFFDMIREAAGKVPGVLGTEKLRIQQSGPDAHVDIDIEVDPTMRVDEAHEISQKVRAEIQLIWPAVQDVIVHIEPYYENDHANR